ncbi:MAG: Zn-dependent oligopeptidase [Bernardetiaceae bacterium]|nr:Zn-dependent oligopeptidase [Bernardetiaceae bacterium]
MQNNSLLHIGNTPIAFKDIKASHIDEAALQAIEKLKASYQTMLEVAPKARNYQNTLKAYDEMFAEFSQVLYPIFLLSHTSPEAEIRDKGNKQVAQMQAVANQISLDKKLYDALAEYAQTPDAKALTGVDKKILKDTLRDLKRNGLALPEAQRNELQNIKDKISTLTIAFQKNIADDEQEFILSEDEIAGLPQDYKDAHRQEDGSYRITLDSPSFRPFMKYAQSETLRKNVMTAYLNRAADTNTEVLESILQLRQRMTHILGYETFADYQLENVMAKKPAKVWEFYESLQNKVRQKADADYQEILIRKQQDVPTAKSVNLWESAYYSEKILQESYQVDSQEIKQYFSLDNVIKGLFEICNKLYGIDFEEQKQPSVWHESVRVFAIKESQKVLAWLYLDLFPRKNKYGHAACFSVVPTRKKPNGERQLVHSALVCNFTPPTKSRPSLLTHGEVTTLFHEFGHGLHQMLSTSDWVATAGTQVARDFVEVPSQLFENWAWNYDVLSQFAHHYETGEPLPRTLFDKMEAAKHFGSGLHIMQQILYGTYDFTLHNRYDIEDENRLPLHVLYQNLQRKLTPYTPIENTHFECGFGHLTGYAAGYYGYLWALVYAEDIGDLFENTGMLDSNLGQRYRKEVLAVGGTIDADEVMQKFLGRALREEPFLRSIGLEK